MENAYLPLPEQSSSHLRAEAKRAGAPAREATERWLQLQIHKAQHDAIAVYPAGIAQTDLDLDPDLEPAGIEHLVKAGQAMK